MPILYSVIFFLTGFFVPAVPVTPETPKPSVADKAFLIASGDQGSTWADFGKAWPEEIQPLSFWADNENYYLGTLNGLYRGRTHLPLTDWQKEFFPGKEITTLSPSRDGVYAISRGKGIYKYYSALVQWKSVQGNLTDKNLNSLLEISTGALLVGADSGLYKSNDQGITWEKILEHGSVSKILESNGHIHCITRSGLWSSADQGANWSHTLISTTPIFQLESTDKGLVALAWGQEFSGITAPNQAFLSTDNGLTWHVAPYTLPAALHHIYDIKQAGKYLFACSDDSLFRSSDQGQTWQLVFKRQDDQGNFLKLTISGDMIYALLINGC